VSYGFVRTLYTNWFLSNRFPFSSFVAQPSPELVTSVSHLFEEPVASNISGYGEISTKYLERIMGIVFAVGDF
jgi:hypothetical protein